MFKAVDWKGRHTPVTATLNSAGAALSVVTVGQQTGLPASWVLGGALAGSAGSVVSGLARGLRKGTLALHAAGWLFAGSWASYVLETQTAFTSGALGSLAAAACGFGAAAGGLHIKHTKDDRRVAEINAAQERVVAAHEWSERFARVANVHGCDILNVEKWKDDKGVETGAGFTLEVQMPQGGASWRTLSAAAESLAADANLPEGCGVEVFSGASRGTAIVKVSTANSLLKTVDVPHDVSELSFSNPFDIGVKRDATLACIEIREFSAMLVGDKRTGKTNELQAIITRLVRMPNLLIWVIDFNGGGVALPWLQAWDEQGRKGRPPIDWVASNDREAEQMALAAVRIAKARKVKYQRHMRKQNTDLLPLTAEIPGILIITDEGAEVYADPKRRHVSDPMKEVLRIAGASGINQLNCFLRATADVTGDTLIKSQSRARIGMRMAVEEDIAYLFGWKCGVKPEDMPDRGYGAVSMDPAGSADIFRGYRVLPNDIDWFVKNTAKYREGGGLDEISLAEAGDVYRTRWADDRAGYIFDNDREAPETEMAATAPGDTVAASADDDEELAPWFGRPALSDEDARANLRKAIEDSGGPTVDEQAAFDRVIQEAGVEPGTWDDPSAWPDGQPPADLTEEPPAAPEPEPTSPDESDNLRVVVFGLVKAMSPNGISVSEIIKALESSYGDDVPRRETITRWLREDDRIYKPTGYGKYAVKPTKEGE